MLSNVLFQLSFGKTPGGGRPSTWGVNNNGDNWQAGVGVNPLNGGSVGAGVSFQFDKKPKGNNETKGEEEKVVQLDDMESNTEKEENDVNSTKDDNDGKDNNIEENEGEKEEDSQ